MINSTAGVFSRMPGYDEPTVRQAFRKAVPLRTVVVYCLDPRIKDTPARVAAEFGETWPGEVLRDEQGRQVGSTTNVFEVVNVGGRAVDALRSITALQHVFGVERVVVVHHTNCGNTTFTPEGLLVAYENEQGTDVSGLYDRGSLAIGDFRESLAHDLTLLRKSPGVPRHVDLFGYLYDIDAGTLTRVLEDRAG